VGAASTSPLLQEVVLAQIDASSPFPYCQVLPRRGVTTSTQSRHLGEGLRVVAQPGLRSCIVWIRLVAARCRLCHCLPARAPQRPVSFSLLVHQTRAGKHRRTEVTPSANLCDLELRVAQQISHTPALAQLTRLTRLSTRNDQLLQDPDPRAWLTLLRCLELAWNLYDGSCCARSRCAGRAHRTERAKREHAAQWS
jgi:hypothetical protein